MEELQSEQWGEALYEDIFDEEDEAQPWELGFELGERQASDDIVQSWNDGDY